MLWNCSFSGNMATGIEGINDTSQLDRTTGRLAPIGRRMRYRKEKLAPLMAIVRAAPLLWQERRNPELVSIMRSYAGWMPLCIFSEPGRWLFALLAARSRFRYPQQRPHAFYVPHLPAKPIRESDDTARFLEENVAAIREEFDRAEGIDRKNPSARLVTSGSWRTRPLMRAAHRDHDNIARYPVTWSIAQRCAITSDTPGDIYFSILAPGTRIKPHCGPTNLRMRYHLTIYPAEGARIRLGDEWRSWEPDRCLVLDDSVEHEVIHDGNEPRVVLIMDCWPGDLTSQERAFITALYRRLRES